MVRFPNRTYRPENKTNPVNLVLVPRYKGYCANLCRTFVVGTPSPKQAEMYATYKSAQAAGIEALKPGAKIRDIDTAAKTGGVRLEDTFHISSGVAKPLTVFPSELKL